MMHFIGALILIALIFIASFVPIQVWDTLGLYTVAIGISALLAIAFYNVSALIGEILSSIFRRNRK